MCASEKNSPILNRFKVKIFFGKRTYRYVCLWKKHPFLNRFKDRIFFWERTYRYMCLWKKAPIFETL
jgi:hypothetical protein